MITYTIPVTLRIIAADATQAADAAWSALTDAFEDYDEFSEITAHDLPYLLKDGWTIGPPTTADRNAR